MLRVATARRESSGRSAARVAAALATCATLAAAAPVAPRFAADPSPHAFEGALYLYATDDASNSGRYWDPTDWRLDRSPDGRRWTDLGAPLDVSAFRWAAPSAKAWAPEAVRRDGRYVFDAPVHGDAIGVAEARPPQGQYRAAIGVPMIMKGRDANAGAGPIHDLLLPGGGDYRRAITYAPLRFGPDGAIDMVRAEAPKVAPWAGS